jgi:hypothetical protein
MTRDAEGPRRGKAFYSIQEFWGYETEKVTVGSLEEKRVDRGSADKELRCRQQDECIEHYLK